MKKVKLGEVGCIVTGNTPSTKDVKNYTSEDICFIKPSDIFDNTITKITNSEFYISEHARSKARILPPKSVLVTCIGIIGKVGVNVAEVAFNQQINAIIPNKEICNYKYLAYSILSAKEKLNCVANAPVVPIINKTQFSELEIPLPSLEEQKEIADRLDKVSSLIEKRKTQLSKLDQLVKSRFIEMFGTIHDNKKWETQKLRNISVSISDGANIDKAYYKEKGDVLFFRIQNVWFNEFRLDDSVYISEEVNNKHLDTSLHHGDLLITKIGRYYTKDSSLGRVSVYLGEDDKANYSNNIMRVRLTGEVCSEFVNVLMNLDDYNRYIREVSVGGTDKRALSKAIIGDLPIIMPPKELQIEFLEFVEQTDKIKLAIQKSIDKLETLKKSLMQQYFG